MIVRTLLCLFLVCVDASLATHAFAHPMSGTLRDQRYVSPTWGYSVRWYANEWSAAGESSVDGVDRLELRDAAGNFASFEGLSAYDGDASICLDDLVASVESMSGTSDVIVVQDEQDLAQSFRDAAHSWIMLLVTLTTDGDRVDYVFYLDCLTLVPGEAVLVRLGIGPASTFDTTADRFDVLDAALPRSARTPAYTGPLVPLYDYSHYTPPFARFHPHGYAVFGRDGREQGMMTLVDGDERTSVVTIENSGAQPLTIDPRRFLLVPDPDQGPTGGTGPAHAVWEETGEDRPRLLSPGDRATLVLTFPASFTDLLPDLGTLGLTYWDEGLQESGPAGRVGLVGIDCYGCAGGYGSRPRLRLRR